MRIGHSSSVLAQHRLTVPVYRVSTYGGTSTPRPPRPGHEPKLGKNPSRAPLGI
jgi:hypothetical protein